jgi:probable selenium-dependent hydroxylase accessory protein YqeC
MAAIDAVGAFILALVPTWEVGMNETIRGLAELRSLVLEASAVPGEVVVAFVGAGGKTSSMFALARSFDSSRNRILVTTTTRILNPDAASPREGRGFGRVLMLPDPSTPASVELLRSEGPRVVLGSACDEDFKLLGIGTERVPDLALLFDVVLVEADGARVLSIKAPAYHEPVLPSRCSAVVGLIGLDALGSAMDGRIAYRPELLGPMVSCAPGEAISLEHLVRLVASPQGLFKGTPSCARRIVVLNKADTVSRALADECAATLAAADATVAVVVGAFGEITEGGSR